MQLRGNKSLSTVSTALKWILAGVLSASAIAAAQSTGLKPVSAWYRLVPPSMRELVYNVALAEEGDLPAQLQIATFYAAGIGSPEGAKPQAALYWLEKAAKRGSTEAMKRAAVMHLLNDAAPDRKERALTWMRTYHQEMETKQTSVKSEEFTGCGDDEYCRDYYPLLASYVRLFMVYPTSARRNGQEGTVLLRLDFKNVPAASIVGKPAAEILANEVKRVMDEALRRLPQPPNLLKIGKAVEIPFNFQLND